MTGRAVGGMSAPASPDDRRLPGIHFRGQGHAHHRGFTLVELAVVLFILSVAVAILLPRLPRLTGTERTSAVRRLALALEAEHEEAAVKKKA